MEPEAGNGNGSSVVKTVIWLVVLILIVGGLVVYGNKGGEKKEVVKEPIKIGVMVPLTGDAAVYGEPARNIYSIAVEEINADGGIDGRPIELVIEDSKCNGKDATSAAQKLINVDKVQVIIGGFCSGESIAATPVATEAKVALFSPGSSSPDLTGISPYFFRNYPSDASQGKILAEVAYGKGWKTVGLLQEQTDYALGINKTFSATFEALGGKLVKEETTSSNTDFRSQLTKLKSAKADAIFIDTQTPALSERIFKQMQDLKWTPALIINDATAGDTKTIAAYATLLEGGITAEFGVDTANPKFQHLLSAYTAKYGGTELPYQSYGQTEYDAVYMLKDAIASVGYNGEKIAGWSRTVKDWEGASGNITIEASGDRAGGHAAKVIKGGKVELLK